MTPGFGGKYQWLAAPAALFVAGLLALSLAYPFSSALASGDWAISAYPMFRFNMEVFHREGVLPMWNPNILGGMTHLASLNVWALYPTELLALPFAPEPHTFYWLDTLLHLWLAGAGLYWWMRLRGMGRTASFTAALFYMLGGRMFTLAGAGHMSWVRSYGLFPWTFGLLELGMRDGRFLWPVLAGAVQSLSVIATGLQFTMQAAVMGAGWLAFRGLRGSGRRLGQYSVFILVMALLSAGVWLPGLEHFRQSLRADASAMAPLANMFNLGLPDLLTFLLPDIYGAWPAYWGPQPLNAASEYFGLVPMALAVLGIIRLGRSGWRWYLLGFAGIILALGPATPVGRLMQDLPLLSGFRAGLRWLFLPYIAGCVFAGYGWEFLSSARKSSAVVAGVFAVFMLVCLAFYASGEQSGGAMLAEPFVKRHVMADHLNPMLVGPGVEKSLMGGAMAGAAAAACFSLALFPAVPPAWLAAALWACSAGDLIRAGSPYFVHEEYSYKGPDPVVRQILNAEALEPVARPFRAASDEYPALANMRMREGIQWIFGYHSLPLSGYFRFFTAASSPGGESLRALLNVKYVVVSRPRPTPGRVTGALPRAYLARESVVCRGIDEALAVMKRLGWTPSVVTVEGRGAVSGRWDARGKLDLKWGRDSMEAGVSARSPALAMFLETWFPAWKAFVDGKRVPVLRACGAFRAVAVPAGEHQVRLAYDSWTLKAGMWCSLSAWMALLLSVLLGAGRRKE